MRLLPRTAKSTWLLATATWVGLCALTWAATSVRPRTVWFGVRETALIGFLPGSPVVVTNRVESDDAIGAETHTGPIRFWNLESGDFNDWFSPTEGIGDSAISPDGRWLVTHHVRPNEREFHLDLCKLQTGLGEVGGFASNR